MTLLPISIALEVAVAMIAVLAACKGRSYLFGLAFTFAVYVLYDVGRLLGWNVEKGILSSPFSLGERERPGRSLGSVSRPGVIAALPAAVT